MLDSSSGLTANGSREHLVKLQLVAVERSRRGQEGLRDERSSCHKLNALHLLNL